MALADSTKAADPPASSPNWAVIDEEILCPLCGYNLRGLANPRCPECGYSFSWPQVLDPAFRLHPWLFEHHPERNVESFIRTALGGFRPSRFWSSLLPVQPSRVRRLICYWAVGVALYGAALLFGLGLEVLGEVKYLAALAAADPSLPYVGITPTKIAMTVLGDRALYASMTLVLLVPALWPFATFAAFLIFQISMRRARLRAVHMLRVCLYSFDQLFWIGMLLGIGLATKLWFVGLLPGWTMQYRVFLALGPQVRFWLPGLITLLLVLGFMPYLHGLWRLRTACKRYLRFNVPFGTVIATQLIALLLVLCFLAFSPMTRPYVFISDSGAYLDRLAAWSR